MATIAPHGDIKETLNPYGKAYLDTGRNEAALSAIEPLDSDLETATTNIAEIIAVRYPGDAKDDPGKVVAAFRIFTKDQLQAMPQHKQFMLMNTTKSGDYYAEYSGVVLEHLLKRAGISHGGYQDRRLCAGRFFPATSTGGQQHNTGKNYAPFVNGPYPQAIYFYDEEADKAKTSYGWCDYSSLGNIGRQNDDPIFVKAGSGLSWPSRRTVRTWYPGCSVRTTS